MNTEEMLNEMSDEECMADKMDKEYEYANKLARSTYQSFLENIAEEAKSIRNLHGQSTAYFFLDCLRDHFKNIDF